AAAGEVDEDADGARDALAAEEEAVLVAVAVEEDEIGVGHAHPLGHAGAREGHGEAAVAEEEQVAPGGAGRAADRARVDAAGELHGGPHAAGEVVEAVDADGDDGVAVGGDDAG